MKQKARNSGNKHEGNTRNKNYTKQIYNREAEKRYGNILYYEKKNKESERVTYFKKKKKKNRKNEIF